MQLKKSILIVIFLNVMFASNANLSFTEKENFPRQINFEDVNWKIPIVYQNIHKNIDEIPLKTKAIILLICSLFIPFFSLMLAPPLPFIGLTIISTLPILFGILLERQNNGDKTIRIMNYISIGCGIISLFLRSLILVFIILFFLGLI